MSEFITIQVGQCGNQIGNCFWKCAVQEYGIDLFHYNRRANFQHLPKFPGSFESFSSFFNCPKNVSLHGMSTIGDLESAHIRARALCIDMEDSVVARFQKGCLRGIFNDDCFLTSYPGSGNNWAEGFLSHGSQHYEDISERIRKAVECCDGLHGFLLLYSLGGGTGSGLGSRILALLADQYPHIDRLVTCVYPAGNEDVITAPYNVALATNELIRNASCVFPVNNQALTEICGRAKLGEIKDKSSRYFQDMNNIIVNMLLHLTSGARFPGSLNVDMNEIATNLVPFPGMHFLSSSVNPLSTITMKPPLPGCTTRIDDILSGTWSRTNQLIKGDPLSEMVLGAALVVRGDASLCDVRRNIEKFKKRVKFASWNQDAVKVGMCSIAPLCHKLSALGLFNSSSLANLFEETSFQFNKLFRRRAHIHHYTKVEGFEIASLFESLEQLQDIAEAYKGLVTHQPAIPPRFNVL